MTVKDLRIQYCQSAINPPFTELFNLDVNEDNEEEVEEYINFLEEIVLQALSKVK
jgi:hypothetical protein